MSKEPLYMLLYVEGRGSEELQLKKAVPYRNKGACEVKLQQMMLDAHIHGGLVDGGLRYCGACVLMEDSSG